MAGPRCDHLREYAGRPRHRGGPRHRSRRRRPAQQAGYRVALTARSADELEAVAQACAGDRPSCVPGDITDASAVERLFAGVEASWGPVEVLVANAGAGVSASVARTTDEQWQRMLDLNLTAPFRCLRRAIPSMVERGYGPHRGHRLRGRQGRRAVHRRLHRQQARRPRPGPLGRRRAGAHRRHGQRGVPRLRRHPDDRRHRRAGSSPRPAAAEPRRAPHPRGQAADRTADHPRRGRRGRHGLRAQRRHDRAGHQRRRGRAVPVSDRHTVAERPRTPRTLALQRVDRASAARFSHAVVGEGRTVFLAGQTALDAYGRIVGERRGGPVRAGAGQPADAPCALPAASRSTWRA